MTLRRTGVRRRPRNTGPTPAVVKLVLKRDQHACVCCGEPLRGERGEGWSIHHRRNRGMGGDPRPETNLPGNLVAVCGHGTAGCHGWLTANSTLAGEQGLVLPKSTPDPSAIPAATWYGVVLLDNDGSYSRLAKAS